MEDKKEILLTQEGYQKLEDELEFKFILSTYFIYKKSMIIVTLSSFLNLLFFQALVLF